MPNGKPTMSQDDKLMGALSYLWILSVVMLIVKKDSAFVKFHATQGLILFVVSIIFWFIPIVGWILNLGVVILVIIGFLKALSGEQWEMPVIGLLAKKIKL
ncbi:MAG: hypothetical protein WC497_06120 [Patescibacteria group bacterium]